MVEDVVTERIGSGYQAFFEITNVMHCFANNAATLDL